MATDLPSFPTYLLPTFSFPRPSFRSRHSSPSVGSSLSATCPTLFYSTTSPTSTANTTPSSSPPDANYFAPDPLHIDDETQPEEDEIATVYKLYRAQPDVLRCSTCATDLAFTSQIVSKGFTGRHGRAYLLSAPDHHKFEEKDTEQRGNLINIKVGKPVNRQLVTGAHVVADITCSICGSCVGWKYVDAKEAQQRYKIGKFILETKRVVGVKRWEDVEMERRDDDDGIGDFEREGGEEKILFDSEDEDECEELFAGTWDRETVGRRREERGELQKKREWSLV